MGLIYAPGCIICSLYFTKKKALATGIASIGCGVGIALISQAMNVINQGYGWKGCAILLAAICPLCFPLAIIDSLLPNNRKINKLESYEKITDEDRKDR